MYIYLILFTNRPLQLLSTIFGLNFLLYKVSVASKQAHRHHGSRHCGSVVKLIISSCIISSYEHVLHAYLLSLYEFIICNYCYDAMQCKRKVTAVRTVQFFLVYLNMICPCPMSIIIILVNEIVIERFVCAMLWIISDYSFCCELAKQNLKQKRAYKL